jgi:hypothetical protein
VTYYAYQFISTNDFGTTFWGINGITEVSLRRKREGIETDFKEIFYYGTGDAYPLVPLFYINEFGGITVLVYDATTGALVARKVFDMFGEVFD